MSEENKALVRRFVNEVQSGGNIDAIDKLCAPGFVNHSAPPECRQTVRASSTL